MNNRRLKPFATYFSFVVEFILFILMMIIGGSDIRITEDNSIKIATSILFIVVMFIGNYFLLSNYGNKKVLHKLFNIFFEEEKN